MMTYNSRQHFVRFHISSPNCCFSTYQGKVCLRSSRYAHGLDQEEAAMIIVDMLQSAHHIKSSFWAPKKDKKPPAGGDDTDGNDIDIDLI